MKREAFALMGLIHSQVGPGFRALCLQQVKPSAKEQLEKTFDANPFEPSTVSSWPRQSLGLLSVSNMPGPGGSGVALDVPKADLFALLTTDVIGKLVSSVEIAYCCH